MAWVNDPVTWAALFIYVLAFVGATYLIGHVVFLFEERARRKRRRAIQEVHRKLAMMNQEERYRTYMNEEEVGK